MNFLRNFAKNVHNGITQPHYHNVSLFLCNMSVILLWHYSPHIKKNNDSYYCSGEPFLRGSLSVFEWIRLRRRDMVLTREENEFLTQNVVVACQTPLSPLTHTTQKSASLCGCVDWTPLVQMHLVANKILVTILGIYMQSSKISNINSKRTLPVLPKNGKRDICKWGAFLNQQGFKEFDEIYFIVYDCVSSCLIFTQLLERLRITT